MIVTGAARGVGYAATCALAESGAHVIAIDRSAAPTFGFSDVELTVADVGAEEEIASIVHLCERDFGRLDGIVSNAVVRGAGRADEVSIDTWDAVMRVNLRGTFLLAHYGIPLMRRSGGGSFVAVASQLGLVGIAGNVAYCAAKAGLINLVRAMAIDYARDRIRVNCVCPGPVRTPGLDDSLREKGLTDEDITSIVPMRRVADINEIVDPILFLLSAHASYMTGSVLVADGGYTAQ